MKNYIILLFTCFFVSTLIAQEEVLSFTQDDGTSLRRKKEGYSFSNTLNGNLAIVFLDRKNIFANLFDENFKKIASVNGEIFPKKYVDILGYSIEGKKYYVLATNSSLKKAAILTLDFKNELTHIKEMKVDLKKEKLINAVHYNNDLFVITANKGNEFILRKLNKDQGFTEVKRFAIKVEDKDQKLLRSGFFEVGLFGGPVSNVTMIDNRVPNALEQTADANKLYQIKNKIFLTLESEEELVTTLHVIDLESLTLKTNVYPYPKPKLDKFKNFNSYILEDNIIQLASSRKEMKIEIKDFNNKVIKDFYLNKDKAITIKNSPIIQEGQTILPFQQRREMEETSKFLRKVTSGNLGLTAYKIKNGYSFTIGGYKKLASGGGMMMPGVPSVVVTSASVGGVFVPTYNPTYTSFYGYSNTKSTFFNTTLDQDFNYVKKEEVEANIFERIKEFKKDIKFETAEEVFFHQDNLFFGYFDSKHKQFHLYKM